MFHVSVLLPHSHSVQQIEKKRHIGNDIVVIIFRDEGCEPFSPNQINSHFNNVFIVVEPTRDSSGVRYYKIAIVAKSGVPVAAPMLPYGGVFEKNEQLRDFLLFKMINSERMALYTSEFISKFKRSRQALLDDIVEKFINRNNTISTDRSSSSGSEPRHNSVVSDYRFLDLEKIFTPRKRSLEPLASPPRITSFRDETGNKDKKKKSLQF